jgi:hypothetical protein
VTTFYWAINKFPEHESCDYSKEIGVNGGWEEEWRREEENSNLLLF